jgi:Fe2+ or Zn2+ uptake regulation protein
MSVIKLTGNAYSIDCEGINIMTRIQKAIIDVVKSSEQHFSANQVYTILKHQFPYISLGTVYRNLNLFTESSMIRRVTRSDSADFYEGNTKPHDHSFCIYCGTMSDIYIPGMKDFTKRHIKGSIVSFDLIVNIICPLCENKDRK